MALLALHVWIVVRNICHSFLKTIAYPCTELCNQTWLVINTGTAPTDERRELIRCSSGLPPAIPEASAYENAGMSCVLSLYALV